MKLWILRPDKEVLKDEEGPWSPWYGRMFGFVIRAKTEEDARVLADKKAGDENSDGKHPWLNSSMSSCIILTNKGEEGIVIYNYKQA